MRRAAAFLRLALLISVSSTSLACSDDTGGDGGDTGTGGEMMGDPEATIVADASVDRACSPSSVAEVSLRATKVGCESGPPAPCTLPNPPPVFDSAAVACPIDAPLELQIDEGGRYAVEVVRDPGATESTACWGEEVVVTTEAVEASQIITTAMVSEAPCPE